MRRRKLVLTPKSLAVAQNIPCRLWDSKGLIVCHSREREGGSFVARVCRAIQIFKCLFHIEYIRFKDIVLQNLPLFPSFFLFL
jgi:hypothetical protein